MYNTTVYDTIDEAYPYMMTLQEFYEERGFLELNQIAKGDNLKIAILDSGVDYYHEKLASRFMPGYNAYKDSEQDLEDKVGHGTIITGLISGKDFGLLENATVYPVKISNNNGSMNLASIVRGIRWATKQNVHIIVMAITSPSDYIELQEAIKEAVEASIVVVCPVANDKQEIGYPARYPETITVCGLEETCNATDLAKANTVIDFSMPSANIASPYYYNRYLTTYGNSIATALAVNYIGMLIDLRLKETGLRFTNAQLRSVFNKYSVINEYGKRVPCFNKLKEENYSLKAKERRYA